MDCPKCKEEMDYEDGIHRFNERTHFCTECDVEITEDITGDIIDYVKETRGE